ncbi:MAG: F0F1 ATP synthase subunit delta [Candidatus Dormibacteraeota bacterium]|nr:F0F1 ATP synthase subunit delta [Candidatus Dormibacteraeota bacterium]
MAGAAAKRYARAIFDLASQQPGQVEAWAERLARVGQVFSDPTVARILDNPTLSVERRQEAVGLVLAGGVDQETLNLARLLVESNRVDKVDEIAEEYRRLADDAAGRVQVTATSAVELSQAEQRQLTERLSTRLGRQVRLATRVDPSIMGGLVIQTGDQVIDASVAMRLQQLKRRLAGV